MIRFATLLCAAMAAGSGLFLYTKKHETLVLNQDIRKTVEETRRVQQETAILRTQWALLNQPDRLSALSQRVLPQLKQVEPTQFVQLTNLRERLPAISHHMIAMTPVREQAQHTLTALTTASAPAATPHNAAHNRNISTTTGAEKQTVTNHTLEQDLALLSETDAPKPIHHHRHDADLALHKSHIVPAHPHTTSTDDVAWHPTASSHQGDHHNHARGIHTAALSNSDDDQSPLPPPIPLTN
ncbi:cell division protein FtsL [Bombella saccharophila]|uniref:Uncharacterized protein n=1 Tax=Bombella saccharophila TaxID=2967338 RepID=A0ABT3W9R0_9PROT|nr:hypothetical protein [Bombella saccharophila]MCX5614353.1 hypothetical protein [Bombella saccharophila]PHI95418.1 hypothetical protein BG621_06580 [Parasaccharibacter apium]